MVAQPSMGNCVHPIVLKACGAAFVTIESPCLNELAITLQGARHLPGHSHANALEAGAAGQRKGVSRERF